MEKLIFVIVCLLSSTSALAGKAYACGTRDRLQVYFAQSPKIATASTKAIAVCRQQSPYPAECVQPICAPYAWQDEPVTRQRVVHQAPARRSSGISEAEQGAIAAANRADEIIRQNKIDKIIKEYDQHHR